MCAKTKTRGASLCQNTSTNLLQDKVVAFKLQEVCFCTLLVLCLACLAIIPMPKRDLRCCHLKSQPQVLIFHHNPPELLALMPRTAAMRSSAAPSTPSDRADSAAAANSSCVQPEATCMLHATLSAHLTQRHMQMDNRRFRKARGAIWCNCRCHKGGALH